jgi:hypothetical protein
MSKLSLKHSVVVSDSDSADPQISSKLQVSIDSVEVMDDTKRAINIPAFSGISVFDLRRSPSYDITTQTSLSNPFVASPTRWRLSWTGVGTALVFKTSRVTSVDATTVFSLIRVGSSPFMTLSTVSGTPMVTTNVVAGDLVFFPQETDLVVPPVNSAVAGRYLRVTSKIASTIEVRDDEGLPDQPTITLGAQFAENFFILSEAGARVGDTLRLSAPQLSGNSGEFTITSVSSNWVEFLSTDSVPQTVLQALGSIEVYDEVYDYISVLSSAPFRVKTVSGEVSLSLLGGVAAYSVTIRTPVLELINDESYPTTAQVLFLRNAQGC